MFDLPRDTVYDHSLAVMKELGVVKLEDRGHGLIKGEVRDVNVTVTVKPLTRRTVELKVRGRNDLFMPNVDTAQDVYNAIAARLQ